MSKIYTGFKDIFSNRQALNINKDMEIINHG